MRGETTKEQWKCQHLVAHLSKVTRPANIINVRRGGRQTAGGRSQTSAEFANGKWGRSGQRKDPKCRNKLKCKSKGAEIEQNEAPSLIPCCATALQGDQSLTRLGWVDLNTECKTASLVLLEV